MAIDFLYMTRLLPLLRRAPPKSRVVFLGYPDLLHSPSMEAVINHQGISGLNVDERMTIETLIEALDLSAIYVDVAPLKGVEEIIDLNFPIAKNYEGKFDLLVDCGTLEHCFNYATAFKNMCSFLKL